MTKKHSKNKYTVTCSKIVIDTSNNDNYDSVAASTSDVVNTVQDKFINKKACKIKVKQVNIHANDLSLAIKTIHQNLQNNFVITNDKTTRRTKTETQSSTTTTTIPPKFLQAIRDDINREITDFCDEVTYMCISFIYLLILFKISQFVLT